MALSNFIYVFWPYFGPHQYSELIFFILSNWHSESDMLSRIYIYIYNIIIFVYYINLFRF